MKFQASIYKGVICPHPAQAGAVAVGFSKFKPDALLDVTVEPQKRTRTLSQNARWWKLIVPAFSEYTGYEAFPERAERLGLAPKDSAHEVLKAMFLPEIEETLPDGTKVFIRPSTASLSTKDMADLQERAERFLNAQGIYLPADER